jgi:hypothetical protein
VTVTRDDPQKRTDNEPGRPPSRPPGPQKGRETSGASRAEETSPAHRSCTAKRDSRRAAPTPGQQVGNLRRPDPSLAKDALHLGDQVLPPDWFGSRADAKACVGMNSDRCGSDRPGSASCSRSALVRRSIPLLVLVRPALIAVPRVRCCRPSAPLPTNHRSPRSGIPFWWPHAKPPQPSESGAKCPDPWRCDTKEPPR